MLAFSSESSRWRAVQERAVQADGVFFYGVLTTGVFCRPSCSSRRPRRENVVFFDTADEAVAAGYRPCKRCRPGAEDETRVLLQRACDLLSSDAGAQTREVAEALGLSNGYFQRWFKRELEVTPQQYRRRVLAERGRDALVKSTSVAGAAYAAGYSASSRFYEGVGRELGMKASAARAGGAGENICFAIRRCSLGQVLIAWTDAGVCQVTLGDSREEVLSRAREALSESRAHAR